MLATDWVLMMRLVSRVRSSVSRDSVPPPTSSWYVSLIFTPFSVRSLSSVLCSAVEPTWSTRSSPASGSIAVSYRFAHAASLAM